MLEKNYKDYTIVSDGKRTYISAFATFDIETTSLENSGFMYVAMLCLGDNVFFFRRWEEVVEAFNIIVRFYKVTVNKRYVVYIHFLPFEFQFMHSFFHWLEIFAVKERVPIRCLTSEGLEFRCSYKLTNMSLEKFTQTTPGVIHVKQSGKDFDYGVIRTCDTKLTDNECYYCYCDVKGLHEGIEKMLEEDTLCTIPLTSTGYVRRDCRKAVLSNRDNYYLIKDGAIDSYIYLLLRTMRRGGDTSCNILFNNEIIDNVVSFDKRSSYPFEMLTKKYPVGKWISDSGTNIDYNRAYILIVELNDIIVKDSDIIGYIAVHKTISKKDWTNANGRIIKAKYVKLVINEIDFKIIKERYNIGSYNVLEAYSCRKQYLPRELRETIMNYYRLKSELKGKDDYLYLKSKNKLNAIFGMMLTDITHPEILFDSGIWSKAEIDIDGELEKYFQNRNTFLLYQWGVWVTSYARESLNEPYMQLYHDLIYCDTDSWKAIVSNEVFKVFDNINSRIESEKDNYDVKPYIGDEIIGIWVNEGTYINFKTLGSKKYAYNDEKGFHITVAGLSKTKGAEYITDELGGNIELFSDNLEIPCGFSGRTVSVYDDDATIRKITVAGSTFTTASSVAVHDTTYTLDRDADYRNCIKEIKKYGINSLT